MTEEPNKPGFLKRNGVRVARYGADRVLNSATREVAINVARSAAGGARSAMRPARFDRDELRDGHSGRYADGGIQRFADLVEENGLGGDDLDVMARHNKRLARIYLAAGVLLVILAFWSVIVSDTMMVKLGGLSAFIAGMVTMALAIRHDFSAWQIEKRAFPGLKAYLEARFS
ncbi:hypothetical protein ACEUZ9_002888 [Paracoccus litorisediminis]|uniref:hypothetical protein n=1 Tax=Paracoccus litorisediminis TaxID=2006130 RepID=UPI0037302F47